jgi:hypothetical protein
MRKPILHQKSIDWIEKAIDRSEYIIIAQPTCSNPINVSEQGICSCNQLHYCYSEILNIIEFFQQSLYIGILA